MKRRWTAANTTECSGFLLRPIMRAAYFPHSVWAVTHVLAQKQSRDCASRSGSSMPSLRTGECIYEQGFTWMSLLQKTTESRKFFAKDKFFFKKALSSMLNPHSNLLSRIYPGHRINRWSLRCYSQKEKPCRLKGNRSKDRGETGATVSVMLGSQSRLSATFLLRKTWNRQVVSGDGRRWRALWGANGNKTSN